MNKYFLSILIMCLGGGQLSARTNTLKRLFHHKAFGSQPANLELGNLVLYFEREPAVQSVTKNKAGQQEKRVLFLPSISINSDEMRKMIVGINQSKGPYTLEMKEIAKPIAGLQITISFDASKIGMNFEKFDSIGLQKGLVFRFYNKKLLDKVELSTMPILKTAQRSSVVIDCGHGGKDPGAIGCNSLYEKDVCLPVGIEIARVLKTQGITAHLARDTDKTVSLDSRTTFANQCQADLFVSIHANSSANKNVSGVETYCINPDLLCAVEADARLCSCLNRKYSKSKKLAHCVHSTLLDTLRPAYSINDRQVRSAVSNVLIGTVMPSVLVEIGFITHEKEGRLLAQATYQKQVAQGIAHGILNYLKQKPARA